MDSHKNFTEEDMKKAIDLLNLIAKKATFKFDTHESIDYVRLLNHMQKITLPKINEHILEVRRVVEVKQEDTTSASEAPDAKGE